MDAASAARGLTAGDNRTPLTGLGHWADHWLLAQVQPGRRVARRVLLAVAATGLAAPLFQW